jgi:hypothetical protein
LRFGEAYALRWELSTPSLGITKAQARLGVDGIYVKGRLFVEDIDVALAGILLGSLLKEVSG